MLWVDLQVLLRIKCEIRTVDDKEDYESIKYYLKDNGIIRLNNICCRTNCYKEKGERE